jgi:hypothetical protein
MLSEKQTENVTQVVESCPEALSSTSSTKKKRVLAIEL